VHSSCAPQRYRDAAAQQVKDYTARLATLSAEDRQAVIARHGRDGTGRSRPTLVRKLVLSSLNDAERAALGRRLTSYNVFVREKTPGLLDLNNTERLQQIGNDWKSLSAPDKQVLLADFQAVAWTLTVLGLCRGGSEDQCHRPRRSTRRVARAH
jgi:hypothetical protein